MNIIIQPWILTIFMHSYVIGAMATDKGGNRMMRRSRLLVFLTVALLCITLTSCTVPERKPLSFLDTAEHHTYTGIAMLEQGKYGDAQREFDLALEVDKEDSKTYTGLALVSAYRGNFTNAFEYIETAEKYASKSEDLLFIHVSKIRLYTMSRQGDNWIINADKQFDAAIKINPAS